MACSLPPPPMTSTVLLISGLVFEVAYAGKHHGNAQFVGLLDGIFVAFLGGWLESRGWHPEVKTEYVMTDEPKPRHRRSLSFFGIARPGANLNVSHDWNDIKKSIEEGWSKEAFEKEKRIGAL